MDNPQRILRLPDVLTRVGLSKPVVYRLMLQDQFPRPLKLSVRAVGWRVEDIDRWLETRAAAWDRTLEKLNPHRRRRVRGCRMQCEEGIDVEIINAPRERSRKITSEQRARGGRVRACRVRASRPRGQDRPSSIDRVGMLETRSRAARRTGGINGTRDSCERCDYSDRSKSPQSASRAESERPSPRGSATEPGSEASRGAS